MKVYLLWLLFAFSSLATYSQDYLPNVSVLKNKTYGERALLLSSFYELGMVQGDSISIFSKIKEIESLAKSNNDYDLELEAQIMRIHYYYYRNEFPKELVVNKLLALDTIAKKEKLLWLEIRVQNMLATYLYFHHKEYARGFEHFERTGKLLNQVTNKEFPLKQICLYQIGSVYFEFKQYKKAISYLIHASNEDSKITRYYYKPPINNMLGICYRELHKIDSSDFYFQKAMTYAKTENDSVWMGILSGNLGYNRFLEKNYPKATQLLNIDLQRALKDKAYGLASNASIILAQIAFKEDQITQANQLANQAKTLAYRSKELYRLEAIYPLMAKIKAATNEPKLTAIYIDSAAIVKDSLSKIFDARILTRAKQNVQLEQLRTEKHLNEHVTKNRILKRNLIIGVLLGLCIIIILLYNRYRLKTKSKEQRIAAQKQTAINKLKFATEQLQGFKKSIVDKNNLLEIVKEELKASKQEIKTLKVASKTIDETNTKKSVLNTLQESAILTDKDWRDFVNLFESVYPHFFENLKTRYPEISASETKVLALSKLQLENKEMALILGVGTGSIRQTKLRIRQKLNLTTEVDLYEIIKHFYP